MFQISYFSLGEAVASPSIYSQCTLLLCGKDWMGATNLHKAARALVSKWSFYTNTAPTLQVHHPLRCKEFG